MGVNRNFRGEPDTARAKERTWARLGLSALKIPYDHLQAHGVQVNRLVEHANQRSMYFADPDGNGLEIYYEFPTSRELFRRGRGDRDFVFRRPGAALGFFGA